MNNYDIMIYRHIPSADAPTSTTSEEAVAAMEELGLILKEIYLTLKKDGFRLINGKLVKTKENAEKTENQHANNQRH